MTRRLLYGIVPDRPRWIIHVVRFTDDDAPDIHDIDDTAAKLRDHMLSKHGEQAANVVVIAGHSKETLRLFGDSHAVSRVRAAMFNAAINWSPIEID
jgi:hypothetical protein